MFDLVQWGVSETDPNFAEELRERLEDVLTAFASAIAEGVPNVMWRVDQPKSVIYEFVAVVTFAKHSNPRDELVGVSVECRDRHSGWTIDAIDLEAMPIFEVPLHECNEIDMSSPKAAASGIQVILGRLSDRVVSELSSAA